MSESTIVLDRSPVTVLEPLLADLDSVLGFRPTRSLALRIRRPARPFAVLRLDLPGPPASRQEGERLAAAVVGLLARVPGAGSLDLVAFGEPSARVSTTRAAPGCAPDAGGRAEPPAEEARRLLAAVSAVRRGAQAAGYAVLEGWCVSGERALEAFSARGPGARSGPGSGEGAARGWIEVSPGPELKPAGGGGDVHSGGFVPIPEASEQCRARSLATLAALGGSKAGSGPDWMAERVRLWHEALAREAPPSEARSVELGAWLQHKRVRDGVLVMCAWGLDAGLRVLPGGSRQEADRYFGAVLGEGSVAPDDVRVRAAVELLRRIVECSPVTLAAAPLTILAWLEWTRGRGSVCGAYLRLALLADADYELAVLLGEATSHGRVPEWVRP
ncbi:DUF4192 domain-containing protein [Herbiconiux moechotypicola]|uniref:DUF4192 family protein n=1 Tax=Herbiconiux moechotypicola TaxID=637393 RepID=A0ABN3D8W5_9MICO|nr:DUF4192 domain-containing protein [Herbiconiux moechotypicola]MCS5728309.1 DUF4192 domain-containing protein [Herbiconiux moechotypicola]